VSSTGGTDEVSTIRLADGRRLAFAEFGDSAGSPVVSMHGWMSSRLVRHPDDRLTASLGVRLITVDRPGVGRSDPQPGMTMPGVAADVAALADALGLDRFAVLGHSGGGPFALACAARLAGRVTRAGVACSFAPFDRPRGLAALTPRMRGFVRLLRLAPWLAGPMMRNLPRDHRRDPERAFAKQFGELCPGDRAALDDPAIRANLLEAAVEALRGGSAGVAQEARVIFARRWGFAPGEVAVPTALWYGSADTIVPVEMGRHLADQIPDARLTVFEHEGHMLHVTHWAEILTALARRDSPAPVL
jgi:pimeloyl-ACP methyl ester carboxylesterase